MSQHWDQEPPRDSRLRVVPRPKAKAIAVPQPVISDEMYLTFIHALLALLAPFLIFALVGCESRDGEPVDYGPEVPEGNVLSALAAPLAGSDWTLTQPGTWVKFATYQILAGGQYSAILSDTTQTVTSRVETDTLFAVKIVEGKKIYRQNGEVEKVTREFDLKFAKDPEPTPTPDPGATVNATGAFPTQQSLVRGLVAAAAAQLPAELAEKVRAAEAASRVSYHRLNTTISKGQPPNGCGSFPNCQITYHNIVFDQVVWTGEKGEKIHFEFELSPDVPQTAGFNMSSIFPFYPGLIKSCVTLMVPVSETSRTMLTECQEVFDFYAAPQP